MQGSFRFFKILYKSSPIRTDLPVPNSPARIIIVFLGIPLGRTLSRASIPVSSNPGKLFASPTRLNSHLWKINDVLLVLPTHITFLARLLRRDSPLYSCLPRRKGAPGLHGCAAILALYDRF